MSTRKRAKKERENAGHGNGASPSGRGPAPVSPALADLARACARVAFEGLGECAGASGAPVASRRLVNHLRGNLAPPDGREGADSGSVHGVFWAVSASWVEALVDGLAEEGYIETAPPPRRGLILTAAGRRALAEGEPVDPAVLPRCAALGDHPEVEERLLALRRRLAAAEGRPPFSIFSNGTLAHLAAHRPGGMAELAATPGLGEARLRRYGRKILAALRKELRDARVQRSSR